MLLTIIFYKQKYFQPTRNIPGIFVKCFFSVGMFGTFREHLGSDGKVVFVLKLFDLIITNVDLFADSSNHEVIFPEYSRNIPNFCFKNIPRISPEYCKVMKIFLEVKKFKKMFCGLSCENFNIGSLLSCNVFLNLIETVLHLE